MKSLIRTSNQTNNGNPITLDYKPVLTSDGVRGGGGVGCRKFPLLSEPQEENFCDTWTSCTHIKDDRVEMEEYGFPNDSTEA